MQPKPFLHLEQEVEQPFVFAFVDKVTVDQPFFFPAGLDPVAFEIIKALDKVGVVIVEKLMGVFGGFDRHAVA